MKKAKVKTNAKVNLTLDVLGVKDGYHQINSLVASVSIADAITVKKRKDKEISLKILGKKLDCKKEENSAFKAAVLFRDTFDTLGVDIIVNKKIAVGGGLGGSSADAAGVLNAMKILFNVEKSVKDLADSLGSDTGYMLSGGYAEISGRGEKVDKLNLNKKLYLLIAVLDKGILAKDSYKEFDRQNKGYEPITKKAVSLLKKDKIKEFIKVIKNDLEQASCVLLKEIKRVIDIMSAVGKGVMTGSGSSVFALFERKKEQKNAQKKLKKLGLKTIRATTV